MFIRELLTSKPAEIYIIYIYILCYNDEKATVNSSKMVF